MSVTTTPETIVEPAAVEFLKKQGAERDFETICALVRTCFPELRALEAKLEEDGDEPNWYRVIVYVTLPENHPVDLFLQQNRRYHDSLVLQLPPQRTMPFGLMPIFSQDSR